MFLLLIYIINMVVIYGFINNTYGLSIKWIIKYIVVGLYGPKYQ